MTSKVKVEIESFQKENMYSKLKGLYEVNEECTSWIKNLYNQKFMF